MFPIILKTLQWPKNLELCNTFMGSLGLRMGLVDYDSHYPKGIAWWKAKKNQSYAIPSFGILQVIWHATYKTMDSFLQ
jgi:hypothetical protein